jgi:tRNA-2-methylthio-N6-dimethylallyladenosine synthase
MNVHDSERLAGLLETAGYVDIASLPAGERPRWPTSSSSTPAPCARTPTTSSTAISAQLRQAKLKNPDLQIAVGGCLAQKDRGTIVERAPWVDVVFGTHNIGSLPALLDRARHNKRAEVEILESLEDLPLHLPTRRDSAYAAWVSISVGCNNTCTFCIVPSLRGKEQDRRPGEILAEIEALVAQGVIEVTLLGQNVNTYGVEFGDRGAFAKLLRACGDIEGLERVRFTSPHPAAFTDDVIEAMARPPTSCRNCTCRCSPAPTAS